MNKSNKIIFLINSFYLIHTNYFSLVVVVLVLLISSTLFNASYSRSIIVSSDSEDVIRLIFADLFDANESLPTVPIGALRRTKATGNIQDLVCVFIPKNVNR